jgi:polar amino acid transport system substrate-binding protein
MDLTYPPFEMRSPSGKPDGVGVKMAEALAVELGLPLEVVATDFDGLLTALKTGTIDLIISSMTATEERRQSIDFSDPYAYTALAMLVAMDSPVQSVADLKQPGRKIVVRLATTGELFAKKHLPEVARIELRDDPACVAEVEQGRVDAYIYDQLSVWRYHRKNPTTTRVLLQPIQEEAWAIGIRKGNDPLREQVNAFLKKFRASGGFERLGDAFLAEEKKVLSEMGVPFILR